MTYVVCLVNHLDLREFSALIFLSHFHYHHFSRIEDEEYSSALSFLASDSEEVEDSIVLYGKHFSKYYGKKEEHPIKVGVYIFSK